MSKTLEVITDGRSRREMEQRLNALQTSLNTVETSIMKFENLIEDCQMVEEEVCHIEEDKACQEEEEEIADIKMVEEEEHGDPESSGSRREADTDGIPPLVSTGDTISPEEDALLMQQAPQPADPVAGSHSPRSETGMVSGGGWPSYASLPQATLDPRKMRPHHRSLPFSPSEVLHLNPPLPWKREVGREKTVTSSSGRVRDEATPSCYLNCLIS